MIVFDTNVISELLKAEPDPQVSAWASALAEQPATTSITAWELLYGVSRVPAGRRKIELAAAVERVLEEAADQILPFDEPAARAAASMRAQREDDGRPIATADVQIAGICAAHRATLATRNLRDFEGLGIEIVDPWDGRRSA